MLSRLATSLCRPPRQLLAMASSQKKKAATSAPAPQKRPRKTTTTTTDADESALPPSSHGASPPPQLLAKAERIRVQLADLYPPPVPIPLDHASPFQLLVAVVLSAQATDAKVNVATPALFARAPTPEAMAELGATGILPFVQSIGLAPTKSRNVASLSSILVEKHGGQVPASLDELVALPGVGRKTASVVLSQAFGGRAFPVDTHIHRLAQRWGLALVGPSVEQTERDLRTVFPDSAHWRDLHLRIIFFGREHCPAKAHDPSSCPICSWAAVAPFDAATTAAGAGGGGGGGGAGGESVGGTPKRASSVSPVKAGGGRGGGSALLLAKMTAAAGEDGEGEVKGGKDGSDEDGPRKLQRRQRRSAAA